MSAETINTLAAVIATFIGTLLVVLRSASNQRKTLETTTQKTISTEFDKLQDAQDRANERLQVTFQRIIDAQTGQITDYERQLSAVRKELADYKEALDTTLHEVDTMRGEQRAAQAEYDQRLRAMQTAIDSLTKESAQKDKELDALTKAVKAREDAIGDYAQRVNRLELALADKDTKLTEATTTIGNLKQNEQRTADELQQLRERVRNLEAKVSELQAERGVLLAERDAARAEVVRVQSEKAVLLARIDTLEAQVRQMTAVRIEAAPLAERSAGQVAADALRQELGRT